MKGVVWWGVWAIDWLLTTKGQQLQECYLTWTLLIQTGAVAAFLHENYLNFIIEDAIEDVAAAAGYMSDAGALRSRGRMSTDVC